MDNKVCSAVLTLLLLAWTAPAIGIELQSRFATLDYQKSADLNRLNKVLREGFSFGFGGGGAVKVEAEIRNRLDQFAGRVQEILDMHPNDFHYRLCLLPDSRAVNARYAAEYHKQPGFIAYFSPKSDTIYLSLDDLERTVIVHELAHAVIHHYFNQAPPVKIHELLAQYVENQF
jgi:hypothetical protein